ncbi:MAG: helix-turn-helix transcriptional regulator, partial [Planctomycetes bacterium]|nr:helix-turn-helix transcriptional regulator [Planctomycetota bacterium]
RIDKPTCKCHIAMPCQVFELLTLMGVASTEVPVFSVGRSEEIVRNVSTIRDNLRARMELELIESLREMFDFALRLHRLGHAARIPDYESEPIARAMQMLSENLEDKLNMPEVAQKLGMSYSRFRKSFLRHTGESPGNFRIRRRIERGMAMLTAGQYLIKEIAARLGYPDEYAFSSQFKKIAGLSPKQFRKRGE